MRRFSLLILIFTIVSMSLLTVTGCSKDDDDDNGPTGPSIDPNDYEFYMVVSSTDLRSEYVLSLSSMGTTPIESVELTINGSMVTMVNYMNNWAGFTNMEENSNYQVEMTINEVDYSFDMQVPYVPIVNWPNTWNIPEETEVTWTLAADAEYQDIYGSGQDGYAYDEAYTDLNPSDRSYTIPPNWLDSSLLEYNLLLMEMNFSFDNDLIINCFSSSEMDYAADRQFEKPDKNKLAYEMMLRILEK